MNNLARTHAAYYDRHFFDTLREGVRRSAQEIVPIVVEWFAPQSIIDVGCGDGTWLSIFSANGITDILGIDGDWERN